jgi:YegS/Rv2252/BmrU family lipid kinase
VGILPLGTANDFARSLGIPDELDLAIDVILAGAQRRVCIGEANGHPFLNAAGIGLGPELTKTLDHEHKKRLGVLAYFNSLMKVIGHQRRRRGVLELDGHRRNISFMHITIANGRHYGGGLTIAEDAELDDGLLRVLCIKQQSPMELFSMFATLRWGEDKNEHRDKMELFTAREVSLKTAVPLDVTIDGELDTKTPLSCRIFPDFVDVYAPPRESSADTAEAA